MKNILYKNKGFTLVEMAIVLVIVGLLVGMGAGMIGPLTAMSKVRGSREVVEADIATVVSWAASNNRLPDASSGTSDFKSVVKTPIDSWGRDIIYLYDSVLAPSTATKDTICGRKTTSIAISNSAITPTHTINNAAFIVLSKGDDAQLQTTASDGAITISRSVTGTVTLDPNVSDIVRWVTLDELRSKIGCQGAQLKIVNNELPFGSLPNAYSVKVYADGGVPFATNPNTYKWCVNTLPSGFSAPTGGIQNANCLNANEATWGATTAASELTISFAANAAGLVSGSYQLTVVARDNADNITTSNACSNASPGDNCAQKFFVITINPQ
jgi:prepilin-type N-terminal cleavage/methylation domain-containing protein